MTHRRTRDGARLAVALACAIGAGAATQAAGGGAPAAAPFFSEYVEGSGNNKALELWNGGPDPVTLTGSFDVQIFANGSPTPTATIPLSGSIAPGATFVLVRSAAAAGLLALADQTTTNFLFNGNDAVALRRNGAVIDVIGQIGIDPGLAWGSGDAATLDRTLRRTPGVATGDANGVDEFDPASQWSGHAIDTFDGLRTHVVSPPPPPPPPPAPPPTPPPPPPAPPPAPPPPPANSPPHAAADALTIDEDAPPTTLPVLANDTDADGDALSVTFATGATLGTVDVPGGALEPRYVPDANANGEDRFQYTVSDGRGGVATAAATVTVRPVNDPPVARDDVAATTGPAPVTVAVLANDADVDDEALRVEIATQPAGGTVAAAGNGTVTYTARAGFAGTDSFGYRAIDAAGASATAVVSVSVAPVPEPPPAPPPPPPAPPPAPPPPPPPPAAACASTSPTVLGTPWSDVLFGTVGPDVVHGRGGNDIVLTFGGDDVICLGDGNDIVLSGSGSDLVDTSHGRNLVFSGLEDDTVVTGEGDDWIVGGAGADTCRPGGGTNRLRSCER